LKKALEHFISVARKKEFALHPAITTRTLLQILFFLLPRLLRGLWWKLFIKKSKGLLLVGKSVRIINPQYIEVGKNFIIEDFAELQGLSERKLIFGDNVSVGQYAVIRPSDYYGRSVGAGLRIGNFSNIGPFAYIGCSGYIEIGNNVMISPRVSIYAENHNFAATDVPMKEQGVTKEFVKIEDDCWITSHSVILAGVTIGKGSIVSAGSVVTKDVAPYSIVGGVPAKLIKTRL
jgi:acetyltransferase-like isoleucine patch superfamily enzyme